MTKYDELFNNLNFKQESNQDLSKTYAGLILEFKDNLEEVKSIQRLRYLLVDFKDKNCSKLLFNYFKKQEYDFEGYENLGLTEINLFHPYKMEIEIQSTNAGLFTSIISIETLILYYKKHIMKSNFDLNQFFLTGDRQDNVEEGVQNIENNNEINRTYVEYLLYLFDKEISEIITKSANIYGTVSALNHLVRISNLFAVLEGSKEKFEFKLNKNLNNVSIHCLITKLKFRIIQIIILIASNFSLQNFHPFILLRLRQIIDIYFFDILKFYSKNERHYNSFNNHLDYNTYAELRENFCAEFNINSEFEIYKIVYLWEEIYYMAKLELYRQISLYNVGDMAHFDHKRLLYALITVMTKPIQYKSNKIRSIFKDKFNYPEERYSGPYSNTLIRDYALNILFDKKSNGMDIWGVGELLKDGISRYSIQTVECLIDLLTCKLLKNALIPYRNHLKHFYDWIASSLEVNEEGIPVGWAKDHERSRNPAGFVTAMTLQFIRVFCKFLSFTSDSLARKFFNRNIIENDKLNAIKWDKIIDSYGFKWKFYLLQQDGYINTDLLPYRKNTAIIYGPPGTGKTTSVKAFAKKIGWDFLELQPADFLFEGEDSILNRLYLVFENLNVIRKAVIFIDEVEEFIVDRTGDHVEHRNILFTNFLLPKIQEINEKNESILILSTNDISKVDNAIKRINRIDLLIPISKPTIVGRLQLLVNYIENKDGYDQFVNKVRNYFGQIDNENTHDFSDLIKMFINYLTHSEIYTQAEIRERINKQTFRIISNNEVETIDIDFKNNSDNIITEVINFENKIINGNNTAIDDQNNNNDDLEEQNLMRDNRPIIHRIERIDFFVENKNRRETTIINKKLKDIFEQMKLDNANFSYFINDLPILKEIIIIYFALYLYKQSKNENERIIYNKIINKWIELYKTLNANQTDNDLKLSLNFNRNEYNIHASLKPELIKLVEGFNLHLFTAFEDLTFIDNENKVQKINEIMEEIIINKMKRN